MAFTANILLWRFRHLNIVGCLLKRRPAKGGHAKGVSTRNAPTRTFSSEFFISSYPQGFIWNGIVASIRTLLSLNGFLSFL